MRLWNLLPDSLIGPGSVEGVDIRIEYPLKLPLVQDELVIKTLATHTPEKTLTDGIGPWGVIEL